jgi:uncharacterized protein (TIGR03437 family)
VTRFRILMLIFAGLALLCLLEGRPTRTQSTLRRITNSTEEGININPSISGDGNIVAFESTEDIGGAGGPDHFRAIRANVAVDPPTFLQMGGTRAVAAAISQDGSRIAFASKDDPLGANPDGNSEIFLFDDAGLTQVTNTSPADIANRVTNGNFQPSISDDGRFIAFSSNRDLAGQNADGNLEIFIYDAVATTFAQLTNSNGIVGCSDAKLSGNGAKVAFVRDTGATPSASRDLIIQDRTSGPATVIASQVPTLLLTYGRAISDDGTRVVYSAETATNSSQVFMFDGRGGAVNRQITSLGTRVTEVPLHATISGDGTRIAFATRRNFNSLNSDGSVELYLYDSPTATFSKITNAPPGATADVVSSLNDDGSIVAFSFPRVLSGTVNNTDLANDSEIYVTATTVRPAFGALTAILNGASFGNEPSATKAVAPDSIAVARGSVLANTTSQSQRLPNGTFPANVAGTTVTVNGRAAQIFFVSPGQVNFLLPPATESGTADVIVKNSEDFQSRGSVPSLRTAPGVFTKPGDGAGEGMILNSNTLQAGPFDPTGRNLRLTIFTTGARNATQTMVVIGGDVVPAESVIASPGMPGLDEVRVLVPADLRGTGTVNLSVQCDGRNSNPVTVTFTGDPGRDIFFNEVLADPPTGLAGDANHDGVRDGTQDEFIELVNGTAHDAIGLGGWTIKTRATGGTTETTRFTFASGTTLSAGEAIVVFGGGTFNPGDPVFGCAQVVKATSSSGLSLTNGGLTILVRDGAGHLIREFSYGGSTGLDGGNSQSLTRSPDITGNFVQHTTVAGGRKFSPGLKVDGPPFGNCPGHPAAVSVAPLSTTIDVGQIPQFTAQAFDQYGRAMTGATIAFASDNTTVATIDSTSTNSGTGTATATIGAHNPGTARITATATDGATTANSSPATLTVTGPSLAINDVSLNEGNAGPTTFNFVVSLSRPAPAGGVTFNIATQDNTATVSDNDYVPRTLTTQTIPAGQQTYNFAVTVNGDLNIESNETFLVNVTNVTGASVGDGQGLGTILNDDSPSLSLNDVSANEGNSGTTTFAFTVTSTLPAPAGGITFDIATQDGTATSASGDYVARSLTGQTIPAGQSTYTFAVTVNGDTLVEPNETFSVNISNVSANASVSDSQGSGTIQNDDTANLVISQIYPGGGLSGASFTNDFIELFNRGTTTVDFSLNHYSVQFLSTAGSTWAKTDLTAGTLAPGHYILVKEASGGAVGAPLPTADITGTINLTSTTPGKVALVAGTTLLTGNCPGDDGTAPLNPVNGAIADFVGYLGAAATANHCYEGSGPASFASGSNTAADFRRAGGCTDTNDNASDFLVSTPFPRNSASLSNSCTVGAPPNLAISDVFVAEGNSGTTTVTFTVNLSAPAQGTDVTFDIATQDGTATTANHDYVARSLTNQIIPAGQTTYTFAVTINGDTTVEPDETFQVNVTNVSGATVTDGQGVGTIQNDDLPALSIDDLSANEGNAGTTTFTFTVSLSAPAPAGGVTLDIATADGTATVANNDYVASSLTGQTIAAGQQTHNFDVTVNGDTNVEPNETFLVNVTHVSGATILDGQGQGTIQNDDSPALTINDVSADEGNGGTTTFTFTLSLSEPAQAGGVTFDIATADGTATVANSDYVARSLPAQTIPAGQSSYKFDVTVNGDTLVEPDEAFAVNVTNVTGASALDGQGQGTIKNDDTANLVISEVYAGGGNTGAPYTNDFVEVFNRGATIVNFATTPYSIQYAGATATFGSSKVDLTSGVMAPGHHFLVQLASGGANGVALPTPDATGSLNLASTAGKVVLVVGTTPLSGSGCPLSATVADLVGYGTTADCSENSTRAPAPGNSTADFRKAGGCTDMNDNAADFLVSAPFPRNTAAPINNCVAGALPNLSINDVTVTEGNSGTTIATFTVSLSAPAPSTDITFDMATQNNTATTANNDYIAKSLTKQVIPAGVTTYTFDVTVNGDTNIEPDETFLVNVTNVSGANLLDGQGVGTISNDDLPTLSINDVSLAEGNSGTKLFTFTVSLSAAAPATVTFDIATQDGTATAANNDYLARTLTGQAIAAGQQTYAFDITVNGDTEIEANETFFVNVTNVSGATVLDGQGVGTIQNDDSPALSINDATVTEGNSGTTPAVFTVTLSPASAQTVTVDYTTAPGTAVAGTDYQPTSGTLIFNPGDTTRPITVLVNGDTTNEAICETYFVNLSNPANAVISDNQGQGGIADDDGPKLAISQVFGGGGNSGALYTNDFIEIFNRGNTAVSLNGLSVQYSAATSTSGSFSVTTLPNVSLQPGQYFLIQEASGGAVGSPLPAPDLTTGTIAMAAAAGKVALVNGTAALSAVGCSSGATILDFVGYGSTANCREGSTTADNAAAPGNTTAAFRKLSGCRDTNNNNADFSAGTPTPRNTATALSPCSCSTSYASMFTLDRESWKTSLATLFIDHLAFKPRTSP